MDVETYQANGAMAVAALRETAPTCRATVIPSIPSKQDFGDIDILVEQDARPTLPAAIDRLGAKEVRHNGPVVSIGMPGVDGVVQVDFIYVPAANYEFALAYFGFNDMGNLLGRVAHKAGFKLGERGLLYVVRDEDNSSHVLQELAVTNDWDEALDLLGYDAKRYRAGVNGGFQTMDDVFRYVVSSPYIYADMYTLENRSHAARTRDRKRPTYRAFLEWLEKDEVVVPPPWEDKALVRQFMLQTAKDRFPDFARAHAEAVELNNLRKRAGLKWNGEIARELTGLDGVELGELMQRVRGQFPNKEEMWRWLIDADESEIAEMATGQCVDAGVALDT